MSNCPSRKWKGTPKPVAPDCDYILFIELPWPGESEGILRSSSQALTCPSIYLARWSLRTVPLIAERQAGRM